MKQLTTLLTLIATLLGAGAAEVLIGNKTQIYSMEDTNYFLVMQLDGSTGIMRKVAKTNVFDIIKPPIVGVEDLFVTNNITVTGDLAANAGVFGSTIDATGSIVTGGSIGALGHYFTDALQAPNSNLTNYTVAAATAQRTINMTNNVRFTLVSGGAAGKAYFPAYHLTNYSGSTWTLEFTNTWKALGSTTNSVATGKDVLLQLMVKGSDVYYWMTGNY